MGHWSIKTALLPNLYDDIRRLLFLRASCCCTSGRAFAPCVRSIADAAALEPCRAATDNIKI
eukprot:17949-Heterococcus_DN1.PRE.2